MRRVTLFLLLLLALASLCAQNTLTLSGLNEAKYVYRTAADSLHSYFRDSFGFGMGYKNFSFGMKFIAELPKYSTNQSELLGELSADRLNMTWKELYVSYAKDAYIAYAGTIEETFGSGIVFRSFQDIELDQDHRVTGFKFGYDNNLRVKALYSGIASPANDDKLDLAYGLDAEYPFFNELTLGASAVAIRNLTSFDDYSENDVYGGRLKYQSGVIEASAEYSQRDLYHRGMGLADVAGSALYGTLNLSFSPIQFGAAYKSYDHFQYRLQDLPLANHHNETLADNQGSGEDEEGVQGWTTFALFNDFSFNLDYAEAWNADKTRKMNDAYAGLEWTNDAVTAAVSYSQVEKVDDVLSHWQRETYPAFNVSFPAGKVNFVTSGEFKIVDKQSFDVETKHYEPKLQADMSLGKMSLSLGGGSWWNGFDTIMDSRYWANMEAKYPIAEGTELVLFGGKEPGGKVCRNGVCRYVAPFSGVKVELSTRF